VDEVITFPLVIIDKAFCNLSFSKWWLSAILDLFGTYLDHPRRVGSWWSLSLCKIWLWSMQQFQ